MYWIIENEEGVIYEDDSEDDEDYVWVDHVEPVEERSSGETEAKDIGDDKSLESNEQDHMIMSTTTYQMMSMYLRPLMTAKSVVLRGFNMRQKVSVVMMGR
jgi:hypothetical protein